VDSSEGAAATLVGDDAGTGAFRQKVLVDPRGVALRLTWHPETETCVVSTWHGGVCTATFRLPVGDVADVSGFLSSVLSDWSLGVLTDRATHQPERTAGQAGPVATGPAPTGPAPVGSPVTVEPSLSIFDWARRTGRSWRAHRRNNAP
jgi:hypothetical protein